MYESTGSRWGLTVCLWVSAGFLLISFACSITLPPLPDTSNTGNDKSNTPTHDTKDVAVELPACANSTELNVEKIEGK